MSDVSWVVTVNLLSAAVFTPFLGSLGDALGRERVLVITLALTTAGSVLVALSTALPPVLVGRVLLGIGFAAMPRSTRHRLPRLRRREQHHRCGAKHVRETAA